MERITFEKLRQLERVYLLGKVLCFPTDTIYGLGVLYNDDVAMERIYKIKGRERSKPLVNLCSSINQIRDLGVEIPIIAENLIKKYWPGALTLIFTYKSDKISFRMPNCVPLLELINHFGLLPTTSVNESNKPELNSYNDINSHFGEEIDYFVIDEFPFSKEASTVIDLSDGKIEIIRQGSVKL